jgi:hypothetical protein
MENVKNHKKRERLPQIKRPVMMRIECSRTEEAEESFIVWEKKEKMELMRIGTSSTSQSPQTGRHLSK